MAPSCSIYDVKFTNLAEEYKNGVEENLSEDVDFFHADPPYNVRKFQNDDHADFDVLGLNDMRDMAQNLGDLMKPGAQGLVSCADLQFLSEKKALFGKNRKARQ